MQVSDVARDALLWALNVVNRQFQDNVMFGQLTDVDVDQSTGIGIWRVTLRAVVLERPGYRLTYPRQGVHTKIHTACWHVHAAYVAALPAYASYTDGESHWHRVSDGDALKVEWVGKPWEKKIAVTDLCDCDPDRHRKVAV